jgi:hypothetical protein
MIDTIHERNSMPYDSRWVEPELFLDHGGVRIWRTYKNDELSEPLFNWFTLHPLCETGNCECEGLLCKHIFDVRGLEAWRARPTTPDGDAAIREVLTAAIDAGEIKEPSNPWPRGVPIAPHV